MGTTEQSKSMEPDSRRQLLGFIMQNSRRVYLPALVVTGLLGFALSSSVYKVSQGWLVATVTSLLIIVLYLMIFKPGL